MVEALASPRLRPPYTKMVEYELPIGLYPTETVSMSVGQFGWFHGMDAARRPGEFRTPD